MATDIFTRKTDVYGGGFAADQVMMTFPKVFDNSTGILRGGEIGFLIQRLNMVYQQQITRLFEVGGQAIYYVGGRTNGEIGVDRVIGPRVISADFYGTYGNLCNAKTNTLDFSLETQCPTTGQGTNAFLQGVDYTAHMCVITSIGITVASADMLINEALRLMTSNLQYKEYSAGWAGGAVTPGALG